MKLRYNLLLFYAITFVMVAGIFTACTDEKDGQPNKGKPQINYVRITRPQSSDSLLTSGNQSGMVAIVGVNLQDAQQVWFNNRRAELVSTFISSTSIITRIPAEIPTKITNKLVLVFSNGDSLKHDFVVDISEPFVNTMKNEYALTGEVTTIAGSFFYEPLTVTFTGGVTGELVKVEVGLLEVKIPEGALPGPITVKTNFGEASSNFWFRDNRNVFISSDPFTGWWNQDYVVSDPGEGAPPKINGNYIRVKKPIGAWTWNEIAGGPPAAMGDISKNIPDEAILNPAAYNFKFEVNTIKPYTNNVIKFNLGLSKDFNNDEYRWLPPYDTQGKWETVIIPLEDVMENFTTSVSPDGYYTRILFHGPGDLDADISFDNFRVVPKTLK